MHSKKFIDKLRIFFFWLAKFLQFGRKSAKYPEIRASEASTIIHTYIYIRWRTAGCRHKGISNAPYQVNLFPSSRKVYFARFIPRSKIIDTALPFFKKFYPRIRKLPSGVLWATLSKIFERIKPYLYRGPCEYHRSEINSWNATTMAGNTRMENWRGGWKETFVNRLFELRYSQRYRQKPIKSGYGERDDLTGWKRPSCLENWRKTFGPAD